MSLKKFVIEREIPNVGKLGKEQLRATAAKSDRACANWDPEFSGRSRYVTADRNVLCVPGKR